MAELLMLTLLGALTTGAAAVLYRLHGRIAASAEQIQFGEVRLAERQRVLDSTQRLAAASALAEVTVEGGTRLVRGVHHGIAAIPFTVLEAIPVTRGPSKIVRKTHDVVADSVYGTISTANRIIGRVLRGTGKPPNKKPDRDA